MKPKRRLKLSVASYFCGMKKQVQQSPFFALRLLMRLILCVAAIPASGQEYRIEKLSEIINSPFDEITPIPSRDGSMLYFTRVGHPDFCRTLLIDSVDVSVEETPEQYQQSLIWVYSQIAGRPVRLPQNSAFNQDVWIAKGDTATFYETIHPEYPLNSALPNSLVALTPDPNTFYVINQFKPNGDMSEGSPKSNASRTARGAFLSRLT